MKDTMAFIPIEGTYDARFDKAPEIRLKFRKANFDASALTEEESDVLSGYYIAALGVMNYDLKRAVSTNTNNDFHIQLEGKATSARNRAEAIQQELSYLNGEQPQLSPLAPTPDGTTEEAAAMDYNNEVGAPESSGAPFQIVKSRNPKRGREVIHDLFNFPRSKIANSIPHF